MAYTYHGRPSGIGQERSFAIAADRPVVDGRTGIGNRHGRENMRYDLGYGLDTEDSKLHPAISEVLHYIWDPIGVAGVPEARDEYDGYVNGVLSLLRSDATESEIVDHLVDIETNGMGIERPRENSAETVELLLRWRVLVSR